MMKKSLIIIGTFLYISILITGLPFQINTNPIGNNSNSSLDTINQFVYAQVDGDNGDSSSDNGDSSSDNGDSSSDNGDSNSDNGDSSSDNGDSSSDNGDSSSHKGIVDPNVGSKENTENSTPQFSGNPTIEDDKGGKNDASEENTENSTPEFINSPDDDTSGEPPISSNEPPIGGGDNEPPIGGGDNEPPIGGGDNEPPIGGGDNEPPKRGDNTQNSKHKSDIKEKINFEFEKITKIISKTENKVIVKDDRNNDNEILIVSDPTCPTQSENVELNGIINPKSIRLLANFYPCIIENGGITMNIPESPHLKMAVIYIDNNSDNHAGTLISPTKIQSIDKNQGLFSIELDKKITGNDPITGELTTLNKINGLALYNNGNAPLEFKAGSSVALTATFHN